MIILIRDHDQPRNKGFLELVLPFFVTNHQMTLSSKETVRIVLTKTQLIPTIAFRITTYDISAST